MRGHRTRNVEPTAAAILAREQARAKRERWELLLLSQVRAAKLPEPRREYRFVSEAVAHEGSTPRVLQVFRLFGLGRAGKGRDWRIDFAWPGALAFRMDGPTGDTEASPIESLAVEVEGVVTGKPGHHQRKDGVEYDCDKYLAAALLGFYVLRVTPRQVTAGFALAGIEALLGREG